MKHHRLVRSLLRAAILAAATLIGIALAQPMTSIRLAHMSPDAPRIDMVVDNQLFLRDAEYGQITQYRHLPAGQHEISVYPHRLPEATTEGDGPQALEPITMLVDLEEGMYYTVAVSGFYEPPSGEEQSGALHVTVNPADASVRVTGPRSYVSNFSGESQLTGLAPGSYSVHAQAQGHSPAIFEVEVNEGETTTVSITLQEGEEEAPDPAAVRQPEGAANTWRPLELHALRDELNEVPPPGGVRVRLVHLSPTTDAVDLLAIASDGGGEPSVVASDLVFPNGGGYVRLPGYQYRLQLRLAGTDGILAETADLDLAPSGTYTLFLVREPEDNSLRIVPAVDLLLFARP